jgi:hypothetical protein
VIFKKVDRFIALLFLPMQLKFDLMIARSNHISNTDNLIRHIYNKRKKTYKKYGITLEYISERIKPKIQKTGFIENKAHSLALKRVKQAVYKSYREGRLKFQDDGMVEYTNKKGRSQVYTIDVLASLTWNILSKEVISITGTPMGALSSVGIFPSDIENILVELKAGDSK